MNVILEQRLLELAQQLDEQDVQRILSIMQDIQQTKQQEIKQQAEILDLSKISISAFANIQDPVAWQRKIRDEW
ncbi:MAG TPA: hypothetical protein PLX05_06740 [Acinetobacter parvus]|jgi:predicted solute-binding protein|uniref:hypothetical protein n=1 Tax=Acinetobacter parvus TaxID=134533 RepID=UPI002B81AB91|nr:hypothetical protein [Acinetobacter parvus]HRM15319.1 hypothetical protein [Acinetobacter parvus]